MTAIRFTKMHGLGNDFIVLDRRRGDLALSSAQVAAMADRHSGIGCDQLIILEPPVTAGADVFMRIFNADGSPAGACGNATRCVAALVMGQNGAAALVVETISGLLPAALGADGLVTVDMGPARLDWREIPLAQAVDTLHVPAELGPLGDAVCTNMGNPHATYFVEDARSIDLTQLGPALEHHRLFPDRANIGIAQVLAPDRLRLRIWERGAGFTLACGSGACAAAVAAARRGLTGRRVDVVMERGVLAIEWRADGHVLMTGPVATSFDGVLTDDFFAAA